MSCRISVWFLSLGWVLGLTLQAFAADRSELFGIQIIDEKTGRGVPLVELKTVSGVRFVTDSAGWVAIDDPSLLRRKTYFTITSHGYEFPADGFGFHGKAIDLKPGEESILKIKRVNIAERLYRVTGEGIYADSVRLGKKPPIDQPLMNAQVVGQDSVQMAIFRGKYHWFWGDTSRQSYPLGHFGTAGATSEMTANGGLPADVGVNLTYLVDQSGFSRPTVAKEAAHPIWIDGLFVLQDTDGVERLFCAVSVQKSLSEVLARRLMEFDPTESMFKPVAELKVDSPLRPNGQSLVVETGGKKFIYFCRPYPEIRVPADLASIKDPTRYEAYTCLAEGEQTIGPDTKIARDAGGKPIWAWRDNTRPVDDESAKRLKSLGKLKSEEVWFSTKDARSGRPVRLHAGSVNWNTYRQKWVMISVEYGGKTSYLGDVWYLESDKLEGPWDRAVQIAKHDRYSLYNPVHHSQFDQQAGRVIYFEGTYSYTFSRQNDSTPKYDYNQMMYRLDLADERLRP